MEPGVAQEQLTIDDAIRVAIEDEAAGVAALGNVVRGVNGDDAGEAGHRCYSAKRRGRFSGKRPVCPRVLSDDCDRGTTRFVEATDPCPTGGAGDPCADSMGSALLGVPPPPGCPVEPVVPPPGQVASCLDGLNPTWVAFVETNYQDANTLGNVSGVLSFEILGWAAYESGWGTNTAATVNGNFFSWGGKGNVTCPQNADHRWGCFNPGFFLSGLTALESTHNYFKYGGKEGVSAASILLDQFSQGASIQTAFDALAQAGYTPDAGYGAGVATRSAQVLGVELCLTQLGIIGVPNH